MLKTSVLIVAIMAVMSSQQIVKAQAILDKSNWQEIFAEEFNGPLNLSIWIIPNGQTSSYAGCGTISSANVTVSNGELHLSGNSGPNPTTGEVHLKLTNGYFQNNPQLCYDNNHNPATHDQEMLYGLYEIRCKMPKGEGWFAASWLDGSYSWPPEIDMFEYSSNYSDNSDKRLFSTVHWGYGQSECPPQTLNISYTNGTYSIVIPFHNNFTQNSFVPGQSMVLMQDANNYMVGRLVSYNQSTQVAVIDVNTNAFPNHDAIVTNGNPTTNQWRAGCGDKSNRTAGDCSCSTFHKIGTDRDLQNYYHTYSMLVAPDRIIWFIDGKEVRTDLNGDRIPWNCPWHLLHWQFWNTLTKDCTTSPLLQDFIIDYVRIYAPKPGFNYSNAGYVQYSGQKVDFNEHVLAPSFTSLSDKRSFDIDASDRIFCIGTDNKLYSYYWITASLWNTTVSYGSVADMYDHMIWSPVDEGTIYYQTFKREGPVFERKVGDRLINKRNIQSGYASPVTIITDFQTDLRKDNNHKLYYVDISSNIRQYDPVTNSITTIIAGNRVGNFDIQGLGTELFFRDKNNNNIYYSRLNGGVWSVPQQMTFNGNAKSEVLFDNCSNKAYYIANDNTIWSTMLISGSPYSQPIGWWAPGSDNVASNITFNSDCNVIYYIGTDNRLWYYINDKGWIAGSRGNWYNHPLDWNNTNAVGRIKVRLRDNVVYYVDAAHVLQEFYFTPTKPITNLPCNATVNTPFYRVHSTSDTARANMDNAASLAGSELDEIQVYPNPANENLTIDIGTKNFEGLSYTIKDIFGKTVIWGNIGRVKQQIDISFLPSAVYLIQIKESNTLIGLKKFIKK